MDDERITSSVRRVLRCEGEALLALDELLAGQADALVAACRLIHERCGPREGRRVVSGVGKAGLVGRKIAATFASTGTPALFLHPGEARHGDLGMVQEQDVVLALSNSGSSEELVALLPSLARIGCSVIAIAGRSGSPLARHADQLLHIGEVAEACPLGLAPSTSTTAMLALGDGLALTVQELRAFTPEQYARFHPGGALGRRLMTCREAMRSGNRVARIAPDTPVQEAIRAITRARSGSTLLVDDDDTLLGIFTDGDLRRLLAESDDPAATLATPTKRYATMPCRAVHGDELVQSALRLCARHHIEDLPVIDERERVLGMLDLQDLADRGFEV